MNWQQYFLESLEILFLGLGTYFDLKNREIPMLLFGVFGTLGVVFNLVWRYQSMKSIVLGVGIGALFLLMGWVTKEAIGYGDGLGLMIMGLMTGWQRLLSIVLISFFLSGVYGLLKVIGTKASKEERLAFYPFLLTALFGVNWL